MHRKLMRDCITGRPSPLRGKTKIFTEAHLANIRIDQQKRRERERLEKFDRREQAA
jgi:hypothetical protein